MKRDAEDSKKWKEFLDDLNNGLKCENVYSFKAKEN